MNKQSFLFFAAALLASSAVFAQPIKFNNGDTLEVELLYQTDSAITFVHPILGEQSVAKVKISNLATMDLDTLRKVSDVEVNDENRIKAAAAKVIVAKESVEIARTELLKTKVEVDAVNKVDKKAREDANKKLVTVADRFSQANAGVISSKKELKTLKKVIVAEKDLTAAEAKVKKATVELNEAQDSSGRWQQVILTGPEVEAAEEKIELAEKEVDIAKDNLVLAQGGKVDNGLLGTGLFKGWDSSIELGLNGASGRSNNVTLKGGFNSLYEDNSHRWTFTSSYYYDAEAPDGEISTKKKATDNQVKVSLTKDWFFKDSSWFAFASTTYDYDEFKEWDHRLQFSAGPGYQFIKTSDWEFAARAGATGIFEFHREILDLNKVVTGYEDVQNLELAFGLDATWFITAKQRFIVTNYFYPSMTNAGQFRNLANLSWIHDIDWFEGLSIKLGIKDEYNTTEQFKNEFKYNLSLVWGF